MGKTARGKDREAIALSLDVSQGGKDKKKINKIKPKESEAGK